MRTTSTAALAAVMLAILAGCAPGLSGDAYPGDQARKEETVHMGVVESVREIRVEGTRSGVGATAGAIIGGIAGSSVGSGRGAQIASVLGAVAGGVAGQAGEQATTSKDGLEITVRLDSGQLIAIVQDAGEAFRPGERVRVVRGSNAARVTH